ncbi:hypothetical protein AgCh_013918 [Apium graveolens]
MDIMYETPRPDEKKLLARSIVFYKDPVDSALNRRLTKIYRNGKEICVVVGHPMFVEAKKEEKERIRKEKKQAALDAKKLNSSFSSFVISKSDIRTSILFVVAIYPEASHTPNIVPVDELWIFTTTTTEEATMVEPPQVVVEANEPGIDLPQPTAPPLEHDIAEGTAEGSGKVTGSSSRLSSFRKMLSRDRSSRRIHSGLDDDLERQ